MNKKKIKIWSLRIVLITLIFLLLPFALGRCVLDRYSEREKELKTSWRNYVAKQFPEASEALSRTFGFRQLREGEWIQIEGAPVPARVVVLIHGLDEPGNLWMDLIPALEIEGYFVCEFRYPNDQPIRDSSALLALKMNELKGWGANQVILVAHSMGGLVSREFLTSPAINYDHAKDISQIPKVDAFIMLGTPNYGSEWARLRTFIELHDQGMHLLKGEGHFLLGILDGTGEAKNDILPGSQFLEKLNQRTLPEDIPVTLVAGVVSPFSEKDLEEAMQGWEKSLGENSFEKITFLKENLGKLVNGIGDGCVSLDSARLDEVEDFVIVEASHRSMIGNLISSNDRVPPALPIVIDRISRQWRNGFDEQSD